MNSTVNFEALEKDWDLLVNLLRKNGWSAKDKTERKLVNTIKQIVFYGPNGSLAVIELGDPKEVWLGEDEND